jgi:putative mRNA 3-end processing factor
MNIKFLGGCNEVGRSAVLVDGILLDYGLKPTDPPEFPLYVEPKNVMVSHAHLDHSGVVPNLMGMKPRVYMTPPTRDLTFFLARDTIKVAKKRGLKPPFVKEDLQRLMERTTVVDYETPFEVAGCEATLYDAAHIPGSSSIFLNGDKKLFYSGDINTITTRLLNGPNPEYPDADVLIIEGTYFATPHLPRFDLEIAFIDSIIETLEIGGSVVIPCFALGRTQEVLLILDNFGITPCLDGMGIEVLKILYNYPEYLRDAHGLERAFNNATIVDPTKRRSALEEPSVIVTTAGMLEGGPVLSYIDKIKNDEQSRILLTGHQMEGTNGRKALEKGFIEANGKVIRLKPKVEQYDFSAHGGDTELKEVVTYFCNAGTEKVFVMHGENCGDFAAWIRENCECDALAPNSGDEFNI